MAGHDGRMDAEGIQQTPSGGGGEARIKVSLELIAIAELEFWV